MLQSFILKIKTLATAIECIVLAVFCYWVLTHPEKVQIIWVWMWN